MSWFRNMISKFAEMYDLERPGQPQLYKNSPSAAYDRLTQFKKILGDELAEVDSILEKLNGTLPSYSAEVLADIADWLGDIQVYCASEMMKFGLNNDEVLAIIMQSNFSKLGADGKVIMKDGKVQKGPNYWKPEPKLREYIMREWAGGVAPITPKSANLHQVGGNHYKNGNHPEHWDLVTMYGWDYFQGQVIKYVMRCWKKNGLEDLKKARHFLDKYIEVNSPPDMEQGAEQVDGGALTPWAPGVDSRYQDSNEHWQNEGYYGDGTCLYSCRKCKATERAMAAPVYPHGCGNAGALEPCDAAQ